MSFIKYVGIYDRVDVPAHGLAGVFREEKISVSPEVAADLLTQAENWISAEIVWEE